jgi:hypothetical protein
VQLALQLRSRAFRGARGQRSAVALVFDPGPPLNIRDEPPYLGGNIVFVGDHGCTGAWAESNAGRSVRVVAPAFFIARAMARSLDSPNRSVGACSDPGKARLKTHDI